QARTISVTLASHRFLQTTPWITLPRLFKNPQTRLTLGTATRPTLLGMHQPPSTRQRNASLDRIEAVMEWIHESQNRQDARLAKLEDKVDEIKEELAEINQHLTEQAMNCSRCDYGSGDEYSDDATEDDSSESAADGKGGDDYETHEYCNMYDLY
ncbi:hypothetical protein BDP55DRAFT_687694, partial [Colletotrichum godetiae]